MPTLANVSINDNSNWTTMLNMIYPVGSYYLSTKSTSPATIFGGSWSALTGRFLYCNSSTSTGGSNNAIVVSHNHSASSASAGTHSHNGYNVSGADICIMINSNAASAGVSRTTTFVEGGSGNKWVRAQHATQSSGAHAHTITVSSKGSSGTNANMPQYQACYAWYRTA